MDNENDFIAALRASLSQSDSPTSPEDLRASLQSPVTPQPTNARIMNNGATHRSMNEGPDPRALRFDQNSDD